MNIIDAQAAKRRLEEIIRSTAAAALEDFHRTTGLSVQSIDVELITVQLVGEKNPHYVASRVRARVLL